MKVSSLKKKLEATCRCVVEADDAARKQRKRDGKSVRLAEEALNGHQDVLKAMHDNVLGKLADISCTPPFLLAL